MTSIASTTTAPVVLVHGAWHGPWCWDRVTPLLADRGIEFHTVDLPSMDVNAGHRTDIRSDATVLRETLDALDRPAIVLGHSYGGRVITEGAVDHSNAKHLVYLTAFMPDVGESLNDLLARVPNVDLAGALRVGDDKRLSLDPASVGPLFYNDCDGKTVAWARANLRSMASESAAVVQAAAWRTIPSTYVVCTLDRAILPELQLTMAKRASRVVEWPASHSPFASRPGLVADLIGELAR